MFLMVKHYLTLLLKCTDKKAAFLCSLLTILGQVSKTTQDHDMQVCVFIVEYFYSCSVILHFILFSVIVDLKFSGM